MAPTTIDVRPQVVSVGTPSNEHVLVSQKIARELLLGGISNSSLYQLIERSGAPDPRVAVGRGAAIRLSWVDQVLSNCAGRDIRHRVERADGRYAVVPAAVSIKAAATMIACSRQSIYNLEDQLEFVQLLEGRRLVLIESIEALIEKRARSAPGR